MNIYFSLVIPCYNEGEHLEKSLPKVIEVLKSLKKDYELIIIDDKSKDNTVEIINRIIKENKKNSIRFIKHKNNVGRGGTVTEGMLLAKGDVVGFIDIDLEVSADYIPRFIKLIKEGSADIATGERFYPIQFFDPMYFIRTLVSLGNSFIIKTIFNLPINDTETGYKFFNREKIIPVLKKTQNKHWFWDTEIIMRGSLAGLKIKEESVKFVRSKEKTSTVKLIPDIIKHFKALYQFRMALLKEGTEFGKLYNFPFLYTAVMRILFGRKYNSRYTSIAKYIKPKSTVVDVCCGDCMMHKFLKNKKVRYLGLDISSAFVNKALKNGINASLFDLRKDDVPGSDYVILQGSLYQFKNPSSIVRKLYKASKKELIISETVSAHTANSFPFLKKILSWLVSTENKNELFRFNEENFKNILSIYNPEYISAGKDLIAVIKKK